MGFETIPLSGDEPQALRHVCGACGTPLVLPASKAGTSGPCPKCRKWIDGSKFVLREATIRTPVAPLPSSSKAVVRKRMQPVTGGRGRIQADGHLDQEYNDRKELFGTLRVLAVSIAVGAVILFVTLYLRQWMMK